MLFALALIVMAPAKPRLAVLPPQANRVSSETAKTAEQLVLNALAEVQRHQVIGSSDISAILGFERMKDALGCTDLACAVEIAGALGADRLLSVSLSALGEQLIVSMTLIDPQRGAVEARSQASVQNEERRYARAVEDALYGLLGMASPTTSLEILSTPPGADILVDGVGVGRTPAFVARIKPGPHSLRALLVGHQAQLRNVEVKSNTPAGEHFELQSVSAVSDRANIERSVRQNIDDERSRSGRIWIGAGLGVAAGVFLGGAIALLASAPTKEAIMAKEYQTYLAAVTQAEADTSYRNVERAVSRSNLQRGFGVACLVLGVGFGVGALITGLTIPKKAQLSVGMTLLPDGLAGSLGGSF